MYSLLLALIYIAFISLGLPDSLLGSGWPAMHGYFNVPISSMGIITMVISAMTIISSLMSDKLTRKIGTNWVTSISVLLTSLGLFGFSFSTEFWMLILFSIPYGLGAGAIDAALNNYVALHYKAKHMSWLHCFWGLGCIISPFIMSFALSNSSWNDGYRIVGFIQLGITALLFASIPLWKKNELKRGEETVKKNLGLIGVLKIKGVPFLLIGFFAYCSAEATAMGWASTYFTEVKGISEELAAQYAALFYIGITSSRFLAGFVSEKLGDRKLIIIGASILGIGIILLALPLGDIAAIIAFVVIGFGCGPIYPSIIHSTPYNFGAENSGAIIGIQMASAYVGTTFIPPLFGLLGSALGFDIMPIFLAIFVILMITMVEITFRISKKAHQAPLS